LKKPIIIGTRGSELALWQAHYTRSLLSKIGVDTELKIIHTKGDQIQNLSFDKIEGKGFFTKEIETALENGEIDIAVHSHKDLETQDHPHLIIAAVSEREDPRDVLILKLDKISPHLPLQIKENALIGTSSVRRKTQLQNIQSGIQFVDIRGNVPTRIEKLKTGNFDGIVLAAAGLKRLNIDLSKFHVQFLDPHSFVPAPAQGVLAWQCRNSDASIQEVLKKINNEEVASLISIERYVLQKMNGGCQLPLGVFCEKKEGVFQVSVAYSNDINSPHLKFYLSHSDPNQLIEHCLQKIHQWQTFSSAEK